MKILTSLLILMLATSAVADPPLVPPAVPTVEAIPPGPDNIVVVKQGAAAPFTGQLFDGSTALRWANWLQQYRQLLTTTIQHDQQVEQINLNYDAGILKTEQQRNTAAEQDLNQRLASSEKQKAQAEYEAQNPPWYRTVWFGVGIGVVGTVAIAATVAKVR